MLVYVMLGIEHRVSDMLSRDSVSPVPVWVPGLELRLSGLAESLLTEPSLSFPGWSLKEKPKVHKGKHLRVTNMVELPFCIRLC